MKFFNFVPATLLALSHGVSTAATPSTPNLSALDTFVRGVTARNAAVNSTVASFHAGSMSQQTAVSYIKSNASAVGSLVQTFHTSMTGIITALNSSSGSASVADLQNRVNPVLSATAADVRGTYANAATVPGDTTSSATAGDDPISKFFAELAAFFASEQVSWEEFVEGVDCVLTFLLYATGIPAYLPGLGCAFIT